MLDYGRGVGVQNMEWVKRGGREKTNLSPGVEFDARIDNSLIDNSLDSPDA